MSFRLLIECTKDIDELSINFSDGTSTVVGGDDNSHKKPKETQQKTKKRQESKETKQKSPERTDDYLDLDAEFGSVSQDIVQKPIINDVNRPVKVADELKKLDL